MRFVIRPGEMLPLAGLLLLMDPMILRLELPWWTPRMGRCIRIFCIPSFAFAVILPFWTARVWHPSMHRFGQEFGRVLYTARAAIGISWERRLPNGGSEKNKNPFWCTVQTVRRPIGPQKFEEPKICFSTDTVYDRCEDVR